MKPGKIFAEKLSQESPLFLLKNKSRSLWHKSHNSTLNNLTLMLFSCSLYRKYSIFNSSFLSCNLTCKLTGSGGGTGGRAMAFCLGRPGLNPGMDLGFFQFRFAVNLFSLGVGLFQKTRNRTVHTCPYSFLFRIIIYHFINCNLTMCQEKGKQINPKRGSEKPTFFKLANLPLKFLAIEREYLSC